MSTLACACVHVALLTQHAKRVRRIILSTVASLAPPHFLTLSHKWYDYRKNVIANNRFLFSLRHLPVTFLILRIIQRDVVIIVKTWSHKTPVILVRF